MHAAPAIHIHLVEQVPHRAVDYRRVANQEKYRRNLRGYLCRELSPAMDYGPGIGQVVEPVGALLGGYITETEERSASKRPDQTGLAAEVVVDRLRGHLRRGGDAGDRGRDVPQLEEQG